MNKLPFKYHYLLIDLDKSGKNIRCILIETIMPVKLGQGRKRKNVGKNLPHFQFDQFDNHQNREDYDECNHCTTYTGG